MDEYGDPADEQSIEEFVLEKELILGDFLWLENEEQFCGIVDDLMNLSIEELKIWYASAGYENQIIKSMIIHDSLYSECLEEYAAVEDEDNLIAFEEEIYSKYEDKIAEFGGDYTSNYTVEEIDSLTGEVEYFDYLGPYYSYNILRWLCNENGYLVVGREVVKCVDGGWLVVDFIDFEKIEAIGSIDVAILEVSAGELDADCVYFDEQPQIYTRYFLEFQRGFTEKHEVKSDNYKMSLVLYTYPVKFFNRKWQYCTMSIFNKKRNIFGHWVLSRSHTDFDLDVRMNLNSGNSSDLIFVGSEYLSTILKMRNNRIDVDDCCISMGWSGRISNWRGLTLDY